MNPDCLQTFTVNGEIAHDLVFEENTCFDFHQMCMVESAPHIGSVRGWAFRGNIMSTILPGSDLNWELQPGANNVSSFIYSGSTSDSGIVMVWSDNYWSIDGAIR